MYLPFCYLHVHVSVLSSLRERTREKKLSSPPPPVATDQPRRSVVPRTRALRQEAGGSTGETPPPPPTTHPPTTIHPSLPSCYLLITVQESSVIENQTKRACHIYPALNALIKYMCVRTYMYSRVGSQGFDPNLLDPSSSSYGIHYSSFSRKDPPCKEFEPRTDLMRSNATRQCYGSTNSPSPPLQQVLVHRDLWREPPLVLLLFHLIHLITCWLFFLLVTPGYFSALGWRGDTDKYLEHCVICFN